MEKIYQQIDKYDLNKMMQYFILDNFMTGDDIFNMIFHTSDETLKYFLHHIGYYEITKNSSIKEKQKIEKKIYKYTKKKFKKICVCDYPGLLSFDKHITHWRQFLRNDFRRTIKSRNLTLRDISKLHIEMKTLGFSNYENELPLFRDAVILEELPEIIIKRKQKFEERKKYISLVALRGIKSKSGGNIVLPSDLVPLICAYAVPNSKIWNYM